MADEKNNLYRKAQKDDRLIVDSTGKFGFKTLQDAVFAANPGQVIYIKNGHYTETVKIKKPLIIEGESFENTVITNMAGCILKIEDSGEVIIKGIRFEMASGSAIKIASSNKSAYVSVQDCEFAGIGLMGASYGIYTKGAKSTLNVSHCTIENKISCGIKASNGAVVLISESTISAVSAVELTDKNTHFSATKCFFLPWSEKPTRGITVQNYAQCKLINNSFSGFMRAIHADSGAVVNILENKFDANKIWCVYIKDSNTKAFVLNNIFTKNRPGDMMDRLVNKLTIPPEYIISSCVWAEQGAVTEIRKNTFRDNIHCIEIKGRNSSASIIENKFIDNRMFKVYDDFTCNVIIETNTHIDYAVIIRDEASAVISQNDFVNNGIRQVVSDELSDGNIKMSDNKFTSNLNSK